MVKIIIYFENDSDDMETTQVLINTKYICAIESVDDYEDLYFLVMPWGRGYMVDGDTKRKLFG